MGPRLVDLAGQQARSTRCSPASTCAAPPRACSPPSIRHRWPPIELLMVPSRPLDASKIPERGIVLGEPFDPRRIEAALQTFAG